MKKQGEKRNYLGTQFRIEVKVVKGSMEILNSEWNTFRGGNTTPFIGFVKHLLEPQPFPGLGIVNRHW